MKSDALGTLTGANAVGQAITASAASTDHIDLLALGAIPPTVHHSATPVRDLGVGQVVPFLIQVTADFATCDSLKVAIQTDDNDSFSSATTVLETEAVLTANLLAGYIFPIVGIPIRTRERYLRCYFTIAGSNATAGSVWAGVVKSIQMGHPVGGW